MWQRPLFFFIEYIIRKVGGIDLASLINPKCDIDLAFFNIILMLKNITTS
jgi:hypothetical protein